MGEDSIAVLTSRKKKNYRDQAKNPWKYQPGCVCALEKILSLQNPYPARYSEVQGCIPGRVQQKIVQFLDGKLDNFDFFPDIRILATDKLDFRGKEMGCPCSRYIG